VHLKSVNHLLLSSVIDSVTGCFHSECNVRTSESVRLVSSALRHLLAVHDHKLLQARSANSLVHLDACSANSLVHLDAGSAESLVHLDVLSKMTPRNFCDNGHDTRAQFP